MSQQGKLFQSDEKNTLVYGKYLSIALATVTFVTFVFAMVAVPISGSNAPQNTVFSFPYLNTLNQYPRDFIWQYLALLQLLVFFGFVATIKHNTKKERRFFANLSQNFAIISVTILLFVYYTQVMVVPSSLYKGQTDGLALLIQYNPHGLFIALEELGYIMMSLSLLCLVPLSEKGNTRYRPIKITLLISFLLTILSFVLVVVVFGFEKQDRFEILAISIDWITLIIVGVLFFNLYRTEEASR